jgi:hypothetical protein
MAARFDDPDLVSCAGLVPVMRLAQRCGLAELVADRVRIAGIDHGVRTPEQFSAWLAARTDPVHA